MEYKYHTYGSYYGRYYSNESNATLFSLSWIPDIDHKCLTVSFIHRIDSRLDVDMSIFENNTVITQLRLEKNVSTINIIPGFDTRIKLL